MCILYRYNPRMILFHFFHKLNFKLAIFTDKVNEFKVFLLQFYYDSFRTLQMFRLLLKMCIVFGYNPQIIFVTFSEVELSHF